MDRADKLWWNFVHERPFHVLLKFGSRKYCGMACGRLSIGCFAFPTDMWVHSMPNIPSLNEHRGHWHRSKERFACNNKMTWYILLDLGRKRTKSSKIYSFFVYPDLDTPDTIGRFSFVNQFNPKRTMRNEQHSFAYCNQASKIVAQNECIEIYIPRTFHRHCLGRWPIVWRSSGMSSYAILPPAYCSSHNKSTNGCLASSVSVSFVFEWRKKPSSWHHIIASLTCADAFFEKRRSRYAQQKYNLSHVSYSIAFLLYFPCPCFIQERRILHDSKQIFLAYNPTTGFLLFPFHYPIELCASPLLYIVFRFVRKRCKQ